MTDAHASVTPHNLKDGDYGLTGFAKVLPLTHGLALMRYGLVDPKGVGLHDIWGMSNVTAMAGLSLAVVIAFAVAMVALSVRVFTRSAVR